MWKRQPAADRGLKAGRKDEDGLKSSAAGRPPKREVNTGEALRKLVARLNLLD